MNILFGFESRFVINVDERTCCCWCCCCCCNFHVLVESVDCSAGWNSCCRSSGKRIVCGWNLNGVDQTLLIDDCDAAGVRGVGGVGVGGGAGGVHGGVHDVAAGAGAVESGSGAGAGVHGGPAAAESAVLSGGGAAVGVGVGVLVVRLDGRHDCDEKSIYPVVQWKVYHYYGEDAVFGSSCGCAFAVDSQDGFGVCCILPAVADLERFEVRESLVVKLQGVVGLQNVVDEVAIVVVVVGGGGAAAAVVAAGLAAAGGIAAVFRAYVVPFSVPLVSSSVAGLQSSDFPLFQVVSSNVQSLLGQFLIVLSLQHKTHLHPIRSRFHHN